MSNDKIRSVRDMFSSIIGMDWNKGEWIFRGQANIKWPIKPSMLRGTKSIDEEIKEKAMLMSLYNNVEVPYYHGKDPVEYLTVLQHYNIPTRLLDFTKDPLIALYFACCDMNEKEKDGVFIVTNKTYFNDFSLYQYDNEYLVDKYADLRENAVAQRRNIFDIKYFESLFPSPRLRGQNGCFLYFPFATEKPTDKEYISLDQYIKLVNKHNIDQGSENRVCIMTKPVDKLFKAAILTELKTKYFISEETLFFPSFYTFLVEHSFKKFVDRIDEDFQRIKAIHEKRNN